MNLRSMIPGLAIVTLLIGCTPNPELNHVMMKTNRSIDPKDEVLGYSPGDSHAWFRLFAPTLKQVIVVMFDEHDAQEGVQHPMHKKANGVWELQLPNQDLKAYYAYTSLEDPGQLIADPYSRAVVRQNKYRYPSKTLILPQDGFDWEGDAFTGMNLADMVILEAHVRDMSVHPTSGAEQGGSYLGFIEEQQKGGVAHLVDMGYNAVEFLPLQEFGNIEIDFKNPELSVFNDWNPYETNHWGYMTSFFFAPEIYYGSDGTNTRDAWIGQDGRVVIEMKEMVKALHKAGISVILDVVYNHVSQYDENPFKLIDKKAYFRLDQKGDYLSHSGCGNDFQTENPMARKMIVESLVYWMEEYHIDGFRFDLAAMIDLETVDAITAATQAVNPDVLLIGEPWGGGGYNPKELADHGWASWNDHFRNSVKGRNPNKHDIGFTFGNLWNGNDLEHYKKLMRGYLQGEGGFYRHPSQSVNYLESHDDHTLGDFIRLALGKVGPTEKVSRPEVAKLSAEELKLHKFAAFQLLTSQGPIMIAQGQSWGRAKVIANSIGSDPKAGQLDHNSYEKDDETNWLNWDEKALNAELVDFYRGMIAIRKAIPEIRNTTVGTRSFFNGNSGLSYGIKMGAADGVLVLINGEKKKEAAFVLPAGDWSVLADESQAQTTELRKLKGHASLKPQSGMVLVRS